MLKLLHLVLQELEIEIGQNGLILKFSLKDTLLQEIQSLSYQYA